jgi:hypothetical protein
VAKLRFVCYTLTITDIATGWTMHYALKNKAHKWVRAALEHLRLTAVFPFFAIHSDSGSGFLNSALYTWTKEHGILSARGRTGRKNDNCHVEQKNNASVRHIAGYCRFSGDTATAALQAVYDAYGPLLNLYYPCMKLISRVRAGPKYTGSFASKALRYRPSAFSAPPGANGRSRKQKTGAYRSENCCPSGGTEAFGRCRH